MTDSFIIAVLLGYLIIGMGIMFVIRGLPGVLATIIIGWFFLPPGRGVNLPGLPMYTKEFAVSYAVILGVLITESWRITSLRPKLIDLPIAMWVISPLPASVTNGLGLYDGLSEMYSLIFIYAVPYLLGRMYVRTPDDVRVVAKWFILAGLLAVPFVVWESRMSPNLNETVYGYRIAKFHMAKRLGGYRPMLFMRHGLEVGLWMATCAAVALWILITSNKSIRIFGYGTKVPAITILLAAVLCRSFGALILLTGTTAAAVFVRATGLRIVLFMLILTPSIYLGVRLSNIFTPDQLTAIMAQINPERAVSLEARLWQELFIMDHAMEKPLFGWGGQNRYRPVDESGDTDPVDGWTSITLGKTGFFGLISLLCTVSMPSLLLLVRVKGRQLTDAVWAPSIGIMLGIAIFSLDILFNAFPTPLYFIGIGTLASAAVYAQRWQRVLRAHERENKPAQASGAAEQ